MENKINIAELLKDCPTGMELDCSIFDNLEFDRIDKNNGKYPIICRVKTGIDSYNVHTFTKYGCYDTEKYAKCVIFPKGKTTWEGFQRPFKKGDIISNGDYIAIFCKLGAPCRCASSNVVYYYCYYSPRFSKFCEKSDFGIGISKDFKYATKEEREKLFKVINDNGYKWNSEKKTLEKLVDSAEDTNDKIVMAGIYFNRNDYADEVELHLNNYEIEVRDGKTYAIFKNQKPKFKNGDKIKHKDTVLTIITVQTNSYIVKDEPDNFGILMFSQQDKWELINEPKFKVGDRIKRKGVDDIYTFEIASVTQTIYTLKNCCGFLYVESTDKEYELVPNKFDITTFKPFNKVLVRCGSREKWKIQLFERYDKNCKFPFICMGYNKYSQCIPYENNANLLDTANDCDEFYKTWK